MIFGAVCTLAAAGCGDGSSRPADSSPPTVQVLFPAESSIVDGDAVYVRGTATDDASGIAGVRVGGVDADSSDEFATWSATVPITSGPNALAVEVRDRSGNVDAQAAEIRVTSEPIAAWPVTLTIDEAGARLMVVDRGLAGIVAVDLASGEREYFSDRLRPSGQLRFARPEAIAIDPSGNRALVVDGGLRALMAVDLGTGVRTIVSDRESPQTDHIIAPFNSGVALDPSRNRVLILGKPGPSSFPGPVPIRGLNPFPGSSRPLPGVVIVEPEPASILSVDLATGARTVLSGGTTPDATALAAPVGLVVHEATDRAFVADAGLDAIVAVNLATGARTVFSATTLPAPGSPAVNPVGLAIDADANRLLVAVSGPAGRSDTILAVDLATGQRTVVSSDDSEPAGGILVGTLGAQNTITFDRAGNRALRVEVGNSEIEAIGLLTGDRDRFAGMSHVPDADVPFQFPGSVAVDAERGRALVLDPGANAMLGVDLRTGERTTVVPFSAGEALLDPSAGIAVDDDAGLAFVLQFDVAGGELTSELLRVDLSTGTTSVVSGLPLAPSTGLAFIPNSRIALDAGNNRMLALQPESILAVDLESGTQSVFSGFDPALGFPDGDGTPGFAAMAVDAANARALLLQSGTLDLFAVDLETGMASVLSDVPTPPVLSASPVGSLAIDPSGNQVLMLAPTTITAIDLDSGERTDVSEFLSSALHTPMLSPRSIAVDAAGGRALVVDSVVEGLYVVDLETGQRAIMSR